MKTILKLIAAALISMATLVQGEPINSSQDSYISSYVTYDGMYYNYHYIAQSKINNRDISNISIEICDPNEIFDIYSDDAFQALFEKDSFKFDSIKPDGEIFVFGFYSENPPSLNTANIKAANASFLQEVYSPTCVPELGSAILGSFCLLILLSRRNR